MTQQGTTSRTAGDLPRWGAVLLLLVAWGLFFGPALVTGQVFLYRDAAHYYYPLYEHVRALRGEQWFPLWSSAEDLGRPLAGDPTSAVFYPFSVWWALPLPYPRLYTGYIALHALGASAAMYWTLRRIARSRAAAVCGALAYACGGYVIGQHANAVYLVSAVWLPIALHCGQRAVQGQYGPRPIIGAASALAMMILGGDPQTAYHAGLLLLLMAAGPSCASGWRFFRKRLFHSWLEQAGSVTWRTALRPMVCWALIMLLAVAAAAPQVWLGAQWSRASTRAWGESPRSVWEQVAWWRLAQEIAIQDEEAPAAERLTTAGPVVAPLETSAYRFSFPLWRLVELAWPNVCGRTYSEYRRWTKPTLGESSVWFPSTYVGALPLLLAGAALVLPRRDDRRRWLALCAAVSLLAAAGDLGVGRVVNSLLRTTYDSEVGGVYWWCVQVLPSYAMFRYPAKWMVVFAWAVSVLAALGWDDLFQTATPTAWQRRAGRWLVAGLSISVALLAGAVVWRTWWFTLSERAGHDPTFGPLFGLGAWRDVIASLGQFVVVSGIVLTLLSRRTSGRLAASAALLLSVTALDLYVAHGWQLAGVDGERFAVRSAAAQAIAQDVLTHNADDSSRVLVYRDDRRPWRPKEWSRRSSVGRLAELLEWDRHTLHPKHHLIAGDGIPALMESSGPAISAELASVLRVARGTATARDLQPAWDLLAAVGVRYVLEPPGRVGAEQATRLTLPTDVAELTLWRLDTALPRVSMVHQCKTLRPIPAGPPQWLDARTRELFQSGRVRDLAHWALIETDGELPALAMPVDPSIERCSWQDVSGGLLRVDAELGAGGLLIVRELYDPAWQAWVSSDGGPPRRVPVLRANRVMRGIYLPAGRHRVEWVFRPPGLAAAYLVWGAAWILWVVSWAGYVRRGGGGQIGAPC